MERGTIKKVKEETVITISELELVDIVSKHASRVISAVVDVEDEEDANFVLMLVSLNAKITSEVCKELFRDSKE